MNKILITLLALVSIGSLACGPYWTIEDEYYNLFQLDGFEAHKIDESGEEVRENLKQWMAFYDGKLSPSEVMNLVYFTPVHILQQLQKQDYSGHHFSSLNTTEKKVIESLRYLELTRICNKHETSNDPWAYSEKLNYGDEILSLLKDLFDLSSNLEIKQRLLYQRIRFNRYENKQEEALALYHKYQNLVDLPTAIHFYIEDRIAGLLPQDQALKKFAYVYKNSLDRKYSAKQSIKILAPSNNTYPNIEFYADFENAAKIRSEINKLSDTPTRQEVLDIIYAVNPKSEYIYYLINEEVREINYFLLSKTNYGLKYYNSHDFKQKNESGKARKKAIQKAEQLNEWIKQKDAELLRPDLNLFIKTQLLISLDQIERASQELQQYKGDRTTTMYRNLESQIKAHQVKLNQDEDVLKLLENLSDCSIECRSYCRYVLSRRYKSENYDLKSFLLSNGNYSIPENSDVFLLKKMKYLIEKPNKSELDKYLISINGTAENFKKNTYTALLKYALSKLDLKDAEVYLKKLKAKELVINERIFLPNFNPYYDKGIQLKFPLSFKEEFKKVNNTSQLIEVLKKYKVLCAKGEDSEKSYAALALGNFLYNISDFGGNFNFNGGLNTIYTNTIHFKDLNQYHNKKDYESYWVMEHIDVELINSAQDYYSRAFSYAHSDEEKANILFLKARNEGALFHLNGFTFENSSEYIDSDQYSYPTMNKKRRRLYRKYTTNFKALKAYNHTASFDTLYSNCSYFRTYLKH